MAAPVLIREARPDDAHRLGQICYDAFTNISASHNFPPDFTGPEVAVGFMEFLVTFPHAKSVVAEVDGNVVGSSFLWLGEIDGVGPVTVAPEAQGSVGRAMMERTVQYADESEGRGVRLVQAAFNTTSMALYTKLGFDVKEPLVCMQGKPSGTTPAGYAATSLSEADVAEADALCRNVHGHARTGDLMGAIGQGQGLVLRKGGEIVAYTTGLGFFSHSVAQDNASLVALIASSPEVVGSGFLLPSRNAEVFQWCLANGFRIVQPLTLMAKGFYQEPRGAFLPSILY